MDHEYMIKWDPPSDFDCHPLLRSLPSPIAPGPREIYNYSVKDSGFYFVDRQVNPRVAGEALKLFIDEALKHSTEVVVERL